MIQASVISSTGELTITEVSGNENHLKRSSLHEEGYSFIIASNDVGEKLHVVRVRYGTLFAECFESPGRPSPAGSTTATQRRDYTTESTSERLQSTYSIMFPSFVKSYIEIRSSGYKAESCLDSAG